MKLAPGERLFCWEEGRFFEAGSMAGALRTMESGLQALAETYSGGALKVSLCRARGLGFAAGAFFWAGRWGSQVLVLG